jgi:hypothetical protein
MMCVSQRNLQENQHPVDSQSPDVPEHTICKYSFTLGMIVSIGTYCSGLLQSPSAQVMQGNTLHTSWRVEWG